MLIFICTARRHKKPFFWPDAVFVLRTSPEASSGRPQKRVLCLLEAYRGIDTARVIRQLEWHLVALEHGLPSLQWGFRSANKVLLVFETEVALDAVLKRLLVHPEGDGGRRRPSPASPCASARA